MTKPTAAQRLARARARASPCDITGCGYPRQKFGRYCETHDRVAERTGDPRGHTTRASELRPYFTPAAAYIAKHQDHPGIAAALEWCGELLSTARAGPARPSRKASPEARLSAWLAQLHRAGVAAEEVLAVVVAMTWLGEARPRAFCSDQHWRAQLAVRVLRLAPAPWVPVWRGGVGGRKYDRITVGVRTRLAEALTGALGGFALAMARHLNTGPSRLPAAPDRAVLSTPLSPHQDITP